MAKTLLEVSGVSKRFCRRPEYALRYAVADFWREMRGMAPQDTLRPGEFWALRNIDFCLEQGQVMGVLGHNGAGKSTLIHLIAGLMRPTMGSIRLYTNRVALMDASGGLNMVETGRENIAMQLALHGCPGERIAEESEAAIAFAELGDFIDASVGTYSTGMRLRLAFSIYTRLKPDLFIVDEALSGGDMRFRHKFQTYLRSYMDNGGALLFCSHELFQVQTLCKRSLLLNAGCLQICGETTDVLTAYQRMMEASYAEAGAPAKGLNDQLRADNSERMGDAFQRLLSDDTAQREDEEYPEDAATADKPVGGAVQPEADPMPMIESLAIRPVDGDILLPGKPALLEVVCQAPQPFDAVLWSMEVGCTALFPITSLIGGLGDRKYSLAKGRNVLQARIEQLPLAPGEYKLTTMFVDAVSGAMLIRNDTGYTSIQFTVTHQPDRLFNLMVYRKNISYIPVEWK